MKKLLYIIGNSKKEEESSSRTVSRRLVNAILEKIDNVELEELNLYEEHIPQLKGCYFESRSAIVSVEARSSLTKEEQREVAKIEQLCDQFKSADIYVLAVPMWSLSFPALVKEYIDCIIQTGKTIAFKNNKPYGLMNDKPRTFIYVQSSGASIPWLLKPALSKGLNYVQDIMKFIGISNFYELLVDGTGDTEEERQEAIKNATSKIPQLVEKLL
ncbi:FMN-dependent NADH-azoreductase [Acetivibrio saccincola]|uniref:FMN dependent NADH:quinone oxidoreductase n=1 Tax=Acetivibrio saccincola TaxID=1677857 RepID=A0A2S8R9M4_9FIRM|nr:NAD(P)H-dependent oxidoreductase [Acetivibrio saccincola]PQQ66507.1 FMN-dependent NADH-azoreductase [Acetivibrio saccincola]